MLSTAVTAIMKIDPIQSVQRTDNGTTLLGSLARVAGKFWTVMTLVTGLHSVSIAGVFCSGKEIISTRQDLKNQIMTGFGDTLDKGGFSFYCTKTSLTHILFFSASRRLKWKKLRLKTLNHRHEMRWIERSCGSQIHRAGENPPTD